VPPNLDNFTFPSSLLSDCVLRVLRSLTISPMTTTIGQSMVGFLCIPLLHKKRSTVDSSIKSMVHKLIQKPLNCNVNVHKLFKESPRLLNEKHISDCSSTQTNSPHKHDHENMRYTNNVNI